MLATAAVLAACSTTPPSLPLPQATSPALATPEVAAPVPLQPRTSPAQIAALRIALEQQNRLYTVAAPLLMNNAPLCRRNARHGAGFTAKRLDERLQVMTVFPGSGAALNGLQEGDLVLAIGDTKIAPGPNAEHDAAEIMVSTIKARKALNLTILRGSLPLTVKVPLVLACEFKMEVGDTDNVNSYTDGRRVMVTRGMLGFVQTDEELAYVLAKEIAHGALEKKARPGMRAMINKLTALQPAASASLQATGLQPYLPVTDATADKLALFMLARAGCRIDGVRLFWKRLAKLYPATIANTHTALHPATSYRLSVIKAITSSIKLKQLNGLPLIP